MNDSRLWHPWLRINRVLRVMQKRGRTVWILLLIVVLMVGYFAVFGEIIGPFPTCAGLDGAPGLPLATGMEGSPTSATRTAWEPPVLRSPRDRARPPTLSELASFWANPSSP